MSEERREVGGYRLLRRLGSGGMGTVHEAVDADGRRVALKLLHPHIGMDPAARLRLEREVSLLHRVRETGVARVLDAEVEEFEAFIVTELVEGPTLEEDVAEDGPFTPEELATLAHGLAAALRGIHAAGVVHRDFKPGNVMMSDTGPVVIDFGIAQVADDVRLTQTGMVTGTPGYLDPEVIAGAEPSPVCDWWGWAAVLVFAATGRPPFGRGPTAAVLARVATGQVDTGGVEPEIADVLTAALAPAPPDRLTPEAVLEVLDAVAGEGDAGRPTAEGPTRVVAAGAGVATSVLGSGAALADAASTGVLPAVTGTSTTGAGARPASGDAVTAGAGTLPPTNGLAAPADAPTAEVGALPAAGESSETRALPVSSETRVMLQTPPTQRMPQPADPATYPGTPSYPAPPVPETYPARPYGGPYPTDVMAPGGYHGQLDHRGPLDAPPGSGYPEPERAPAWASPAPRRTLVVATVGLGVSALASAVPGVFVLVAVALLVLCAATGWAGRSRRAARLRRGLRPGDDARMLAGLPWHLVRGAVSVLPGLLVGAGFAVAAWWIGTATAVDSPPEPGVLWGAALVGLGAAWLTPTSLAARQGARAMVDVLTPSRGFRALLVVLVLAVVAVVGLQVVLGQPPVPAWAPLPDPTGI